MKICRIDERFDLTGPTAVILGTFDGVHRGHAAVIQAAVRTGLRTVLVTFTRHPALVLKNRRAPELTTARQRERLFADLGVDVLVYLDFEAIYRLSPDDFIQKVLLPLHPAAAFCGFNYTFGAGGKAGPDELERLGARYGFKTCRVPPVCDGGKPVSSTRVRELVEAGRMEDAARLLGRPFSLELPVSHGRELGRRLGIPTINQILPEGFVLPRFGVYAATAEVDGRRLQAVASVGVKPTVGSDAALSETNLFDYSGDLYGRVIEVALHTFLRPEVKFDGIPALKEQMRKDIVHAKGWLCAHPDVRKVGQGV